MTHTQSVGALPLPLFKRSFNRGNRLAVLPRNIPHLFRYFCLGSGALTKDRESLVAPLSVIHRWVSASLFPSTRAVRPLAFLHILGANVIRLRIAVNECRENNAYVPTKAMIP